MKQVGNKSLPIFILYVLFVCFINFIFWWSQKLKGGIEECFHMLADQCVV